MALTPGWPDDPETVTEAREHPELLAGKGITEIADYEEAINRRLDRKPVIIGHSFGGLLTMILAGRGLAAASVAISPAPFRGVLPLPRSPRCARPASPCATPRTGTARSRGSATSSSATASRTRSARRGERAVPRLLRLRRRRAALPGGVGEPQSMDGGEGRLEEPGAGSDANRLGRLGPDGSLGDSRTRPSNCRSATRA